MLARRASSLSVRAILRSSSSSVVSSSVLEEVLGTDGGKRVRELAGVWACGWGGRGSWRAEGWASASGDGCTCLVVSCGGIECRRKGPRREGVVDGEDEKSGGEPTATSV